MTDEPQRRRLLVLMAALMADAIAGLALGTLLNFSPGTLNRVQEAVLVVQILLAAGIVLGGGIQLASTHRARRLAAPAALGLLASLAAFVTGGLSADHTSALAVFAMGTCFIIAWPHTATV